MREYLARRLEVWVAGLPLEDFGKMGLAAPTSEEEEWCLAAVGAGLAVGALLWLEREARKGGAK